MRLTVGSTEEVIPERLRLPAALKREFVSSLAATRASQAVWDICWGLLVSSSAAFVDQEDVHQLLGMGARGLAAEGGQEEEEAEGARPRPGGFSVASVGASPTRPGAGHRAWR
jgi:hypothetical protein